MVDSNIIVLGPSGVGKSTLINALCGDEILSSIEMSKPYSGTDKIESHEIEEYGIRLIDTVGFEPSAVKQKQAVKKVQDWSREGVKKKDDTRSLDLVWFCVDGTSKRVFSAYIKDFINAIKIWKDIPVIVVVTKSYSDLEKQENINEITSSFEKHAKQVNLKGIIPVVAMPYNIREDIIVQSSGLEELVEASLDAIPEGREKKETVMLNYSINMKRLMARTTTVGGVAAAVFVALTKVDFSHALMLEPIERTMIDQIAKQYEITDDEHVQKIKDMLVDSGTVGALAAQAAKFLNNKHISVKGLRISFGNVANAVVAGSIVAGIGESTRYIFEKIYLKDESVESTEWITERLTNETTKNVLDNIAKVFEDLKKQKKISAATILTAIKDAFFAGEKKKDKKLPKAKTKTGDSEK